MTKQLLRSLLFISCAAMALGCTRNDSRLTQGIKEDPVAPSNELRGAEPYNYQFHVEMTHVFPE